ncbi:hypothetical protein J1605_007289 [Eschrichtius robustus]|uniref:Uncharacterized protein n=1 Tax=Eschrichtius robustus TaxID=9764 RepID=A0AB34H3C0_ESCRO|nr:hypothetical protein J1605_007289 [Eschrichtius robustus]
MSRPDCSLLVQKSLATGLENGSNNEVHNSIRTKLKRNWQTVIRAPREPAPGQAAQHLKNVKGASLVAQWLRIRLPMKGTRVQALVREDPTCRGATKPVRHNY